MTQDLTEGMTQGQYDMERSLGWEQTAPAQYPPAPGYMSPVAPRVGAYSAPYTASPAVDDPKAGQAIAALVLGIISMLAWLVPMCGFPFAVAGIVCGMLGRASMSKRTMAKVGLLLAIAGLVLTLANAALGAYLAIR